MRRVHVMFQALLFLSFCAAAQEAPPFPAFQEHVIDAATGVVPGIAVADLNLDGKPDVVAASDNEVAWYENPAWERHLICETLRGLNVALAAQDLNADGIPEIALGADWQPNNTESGGVLFLLKSGPDVRAPWLAMPVLDSVPTLHRLRWADVESDGRPELVVAPLKGVGSTPPAHQETGVKLFLLRPPDDPFTLPWTEELIDNSLHIVHNIWPLPFEKDTKGTLLLAASLEGITAFLRPPDGIWEKRLLAAGNPDPLPQSGAGEIKCRLLGNPMMATVEPWHGNQIVVYTPNGADGEWIRHVVESEFAAAHVVYWADFDGDGQDELLAGHREPAGPENKPGLYVYDLIYDAATHSLQTFRHTLDLGGLAAEDAIATDMNGDGRPDVVASGRATGNIKLYLNQGLAPPPPPAPPAEAPPAPPAETPPAPSAEAPPTPQEAPPAEIPPAPPAEAAPAPQEAPSAETPPAAPTEAAPTPQEVPPAAAPQTN